LNHKLDMLWEIQRLGMNSRDPRMDGFNCWGNKQRLYEILWETQRQLELAPHFSVEDEWLLEKKQERFVEKLQGHR